MRSDFASDIEAAINHAEDVLNLTDRYAPTPRIVKVRKHARDLIHSLHLLLRHAEQKVQS